MVLRLDIDEHDAATTQIVQTSVGVALEQWIGRGFTIDPSTGDVSARDVAIEHVTAGMQSFHKAWSVS
jgi:hypothetical protein